MTTLAANKARAWQLGINAAYPVIASDIIYEGAAVGLVDASGHARPLVALDRFVGFAVAQADNSAGAAAAISVEVRRQGQAQLAVTGAVITDIGQPVYATDDDAFTFVPTAASFIGFVKGFVSAGVAIVEFDVDRLSDPYLAYGAPAERETHAANYTVDIQDNGKVLFVTTDAVVITLPAVATTVDVTVVNIAAFGAALVSVSPNANDMIHAPDLAGTNDKDHLNTKATARRGDLVQLSSGAGNADGWIVRHQIGIWAQQG